MICGRGPAASRATRGTATGSRIRLQQQQQQRQNTTPHLQLSSAGNQSHAGDAIYPTPRRRHPQFAVRKHTCQYTHSQRFLLIAPLTVDSGNQPAVICTRMGQTEHKRRRSPWASRAGMLHGDKTLHGRGLAGNRPSFPVQPRLVKPTLDSATSASSPQAPAPELCLLKCGRMSPKRRQPALPQDFFPCCSPPHCIPAAR